MKLLFFRSLFLVLITGLILSSCKKDEVADPIVGTWTTGTSTFSAMVGSRTLTEYFIEVMGSTPEEAAATEAFFEALMTQAFTGSITIKADNTYTSTLGGQADSGTWSLNADKTELTIDSSSDDPMTYDVVELTSSKLRIQVSASTLYDLNGDETDEIIDVEIDITFTK